MAGHESEPFQVFVGSRQTRIQLRNAFGCEDLFGDIPCYYGGCNDFSALGFHGRHGKRDIYDVTVFAAASSLLLLDHFPAPDTREHTVNLFFSSSRSENRYRLADHLSRRVTVRLLGPAVPTRD